MSRNLLEAAERIAEELTTEEKIRLVKQLAHETLQARWNRLLADVPHLGVNGQRRLEKIPGFVQAPTAPQDFREQTQRVPLATAVAVTLALPTPFAAL